jgi:3-dehydroquinate synthase
LEAATQYRRFLHGEAVAWGMLAATRLSVLGNLLPLPEGNRIEALIASYGPVPSLRKIDPASVYRHMAMDKKVRDGVVHFVLPRRIGKVVIVGGIPQKQVVGILKDLARSNPFRRGGESSFSASAGDE